MANQEHIEILKRGVEYWNKWRKKNPLLEPDLSFLAPKNKFLPNINLSRTNLSNSDFHDVHLAHADLSYAKCIHANFAETFFHYTDLSSVDFSFAKLSEARFYDTELRSAKFCSARLTSARFNDSNLSSSDLRDAYFEYAVFQYADLTDAKCRNTDFSNADLSNCRLIGADLCQANFTNACIGNTHFGDRDFRLIKGLETTWHRGPSPLSINSIYLSQGEISEVFVRGTGAPESFIEYLHAITSKPIDYYTCFIAFSHHNEDFAKRLHADLQVRGVRCWFANEDLKIGDHYHQRIDNAIRLYDKLIIILSEDAVLSTWVEREVVAACEKEERQGREVLFPIRLDDAVMETSRAWAADVRRRWQIGDFTRWKNHDQYQVAFERLLRDLNKEGK